MVLMTSRIFMSVCLPPILRYTERLVEKALAGINRTVAEADLDGIESARGRADSGTLRDWQLPVVRPDQYVPRVTRRVWGTEVKLRPQSVSSPFQMRRKRWSASLETSVELRELFLSAGRLATTSSTRTKSRRPPAADWKSTRQYAPVTQNWLSAILATRARPMGWELPRGAPPDPPGETP